MALAEPRNNPTPIVPPSAMSWIWRSRRLRERCESACDVIEVPRVGCLPGMILPAVRAARSAYLAEPRNAVAQKRRRVLPACRPHHRRGVGADARGQTAGSVPRVHDLGAAPVCGP